MKACEGQRLGHQLFPKIRKRLALGLAETHHVAELADSHEASVKDAGSGRIDDLVDSPALRESPDGGDEILFLAINHSRRAELERALLLALRANGPDDRRPRLNRDLRRRDRLLHRSRVSGPCRPAVSR